MQGSLLDLAGIELPAYAFPTIIIGSGAAALNCAEHLGELGQDYAIVTDCLGGGTSNNSGSDKQTYYKLGVFGDVPDSPMEFARSLYSGGMCHGDLAYVEALGSLPEFFHLIRNGVEFPCNRYGAFVGYKTDHDPRQRATSAGPTTSMQMVQRSLERVQSAGGRIFDRHQVVRLLTAGAGEQRRVIGCVALNLERLEAPDQGLVVFWAANVILATGGPGELYETSVYPAGQSGSHGLALEIGARANNLTESQFGLASTGYRWNLSGSYQQVIPTYFSTDESGGDRHEFLADWYPTLGEVATNTFLKGYQWPFHAGRVTELGSSLIDLAVDEERSRGRTVWMDYTRNPGGGALDPSVLSAEARAYLEKSGATQATPLERLLHMNPLAVEIYRQHGVDLGQPLEIAVCAQHCNGGLSVDIWWQTSIARLYAIGEVAGTHGLRPGGSALNAGQVGGLRAAQHINAHQPGLPDEAECLLAAREQVLEEISRLRDHLHAGLACPRAQDVRRAVQARMSRAAGIIRTLEGAREALGEAQQLWAQIAGGMRVGAADELPQALVTRHLVITHTAFLAALVNLLERGGGSRGGYLVADRAGAAIVTTARGSRLPHRPENLAMRQEVIEVQRGPSGVFTATPVPVRPLPEDDSWYENTWRDWRDGAVYR